MKFKYGVTVLRYIAIMLPAHARRIDTSAPTLRWRKNSTKTQAMICPIKSVIQIQILLQMYFC